MSGHTPGPWKWLPEETRLVEEGVGPVLSPWWNEETGENGIEVSAADARLIAAAPEMLEALEEIEREMSAAARPPFEAAYDTTLREWAATARSAINKATGEEVPR